MAEQTNRIVLGVLLSFPGLLDCSDELSASLFWGKDKKAFEVISGLWESDQPAKIDLATFISKLGFEGAESYASQLLDLSAQGSSNPEMFKSLVGQIVKKKLTKDIIRKIDEQAKSGQFDVDEIRPLLNKYDVAGNRDKKLAEDVRLWVNAAKGEFRLPQIYSELSVVSENSKAAVRQVIARMVREGLIDHAGKDYGRYRRVGKLADPIDLMSVTAAPLDIYLPLGLGELVKIYPKNIFVIAGESSKGKTSLALDFIKHNMDKHIIHYFFKEGGPEELRSRLEPHTDVKMEDWKMLAFEHDGYVADAIAGDGNALYVYDYLHCGDQAYYEIDKMFNDVQNKLHREMALINIQKNRNKQLGDGGDFSLRVPRLYITLSEDRNVESPDPDLQYVVAKIEKAKAWKTTRNPEGKIMPFGIRQGWQIVCRATEWAYPASHEIVRKTKLFGR